MAYEKNKADHIIAEAQSLKDRQIARGLVKLNQRRYQLQKLEKERAILGKQNLMWQRIHKDHYHEYRGSSQPKPEKGSRSLVTPTP